MIFCDRRAKVLYLTVLVVFLSQQSTARAQQTQPLDALLNPDGTLNLSGGFQGSLDPAGYTMTTGPGGEPIFVPAALSGDESWYDDFAQGSTDAPIYAVAVSGSDLYVRSITVYAGGGFSYAGGAWAQFIARWDGSSWSALGDGVNGLVYAIAVSGTDLYVGGDFLDASEVDANNIVKWDGSSWSALVDGVTGVNGVGGPVHAITVSGTDVYVGGYFGLNIARWDGSSWHDLGGGLDDAVYAIAVSDTNVYVGGNFTHAGGLNAYHIARWDGSGWSALGAGVNNEVHAIAVSGSDIYVGGDFTEAGAESASANYIARWDGSSWSALGSGLDGPVNAIAVSDGDLFAGGNFTTAGGASANFIARWDGSGWSALGSGLDEIVNANFNGTDNFVYTVSDGFGGEGVAMVTVTVAPAQDPPTAVTDYASTAEDVAVLVPVLANDYDVDGDAVSLAGVDAPISGQATDNGDGTITYTPATDYNGADAFTYTISDGNGNNAVGTVIVSIGSVNDVPFAVGDAAETAEDTPVTFDVLANDGDVDVQSLLITGTTQGAHGTVAVNLDKTLTYTPVADYNGHDSFVYLVADGAGGTSVGLVQLSITPVNDAPAAFALLPQASSSITVLPDATGDTLAFAWEAAVDVDGDPVWYHFISTGNLALLGLVDTTVTEIKLAHADVWALMDGAGAATLSGTWTVSATDGEYTVKAGSGPQALTINAGALALEDLPGVPSDFALQQNYPNPFNPSTTIRFDLPEAAEVSLLIYDMLGREVARLAKGRREPGYHQVTWNGRDRSGREVPTGLYFAHFMTPAYSHTIRLVLLK